TTEVISAEWRENAECVGSMKKAHGPPSVGVRSAFLVEQFYLSPRLRIMVRKHFPGAPMHDRIAYQGITFDDVLLEPAFSDVVPREVDVRTQLSRNIRLNIPVLSSPMDTVTESELAIALAQEGGIGIIHKNMSIADQTREVER